MNEGMLFTNHPYGDCLTEFLVTRESMDYLVTESPEYNSFQEDNADMSDEEFKEWQKNRIGLLNSKKAEFKVMYSEVGYQDTDRAYNFVIIMLLKENDSWKINNISIQETTPDEMMNFYNAQVELRGYYN